MQKPLFIDALGYQKAVPDDPWASSKAEQFRALGAGVSWRDLDPSSAGTAGEAARCGGSFALSTGPAASAPAPERPRVDNAMVKALARASR